MSENNYSNLSFRELKEKLKQVKNKDKTEEMIIRNLMKQKYLKYKERKKQFCNSDFNFDKFYDEEYKVDDNNKPNIPSNNNLKDELNNHLMDRLSSEMQLYLNVKKPSKKDFIPPYLENGHPSKRK